MYICSCGSYINVFISYIPQSKLLYYLANCIIHRKIVAIAIYCMYRYSQLAGATEVRAQNNFRHNQLMSYSMSFNQLHGNLLKCMIHFVVLLQIILWLKCSPFCTQLATVLLLWWRFSFMHPPQLLHVVHNQSTTLNMHGYSIQLAKQLLLSMVIITMQIEFVCVII